MKIAMAWEAGLRRFPIQWHGPKDAAEPVWFVDGSVASRSEFAFPMMLGDGACTVGQCLAGVDGEVVRQGDKFFDRRGGENWSKAAREHFPILAKPPIRLPQFHSEGCYRTVEEVVHVLNRLRYPSWQILEWLTELEQEVQWWIDLQEEVSFKRRTVLRALGKREPEELEVALETEQLEMKLWLKAMGKKGGE